MKTIKQQLAAAALAALCIATSAQAASVSTILDRSSIDHLLPDGGQYLEVTVSDGVDGAIDFNVQTLDGLLNLNPSPVYGIQQFAMNFGESAASISDLVLPTGWTATAANERDFDKHGFGMFDVIIHTTREGRVDPLQFSIVGVDDDMVNSYLTDLSVGPAANGNVLFGAHVVGFTGGDDEWGSVSAAKFGGGVSVVPVPPALALMLSGVALLGGLSRRKKSAAQA